jgi:hypothetical protein
MEKRNQPDGQGQELPPAGFFRSITPDDQQDIAPTDSVNSMVEAVIDGLTPGGGPDKDERG